MTNAGTIVRYCSNCTGTVLYCTGTVLCVLAEVHHGSSVVMMLEPPPRSVTRIIERQAWVR